MRNYIRSGTAALAGMLAIFFIAATPGCKPKNPVKPGDEGTNIMRRRSALYSYKNGKWKAVTNVYPGETLTVTGHQDVTDKKGKTVRYSKAKTTDGKSGLINPKIYLALAAVVITADGASLYRRNSEVSGKGRGAANVKPGTLAFVLERSGEGKWLQVISGPGSYFKGWLAAGKGISKDTNLIASSLELTRIRSAVASKGLDEKKLEQIRKDVENLTGKPEPFASAAQQLLTEVNAKIEALKNQPEPPADSPVSPGGLPDGPPGADG